MAKVFIEETTLTSIGDAIREKGNTNELISPLDMANAITNLPSGGGGGVELPEEGLTITGDCSYRFGYNGWNWYINEFSDKMTTSDITNCYYMFYGNTLDTIPFDINCKIDTSVNMANIFDNSLIKEVPRVLNCKIGRLNDAFNAAKYLREIPDEFCDTWDWSYLQNSSSKDCSATFRSCYSLRRVTPIFMKNAYNGYNRNSNSMYYNYFNSCTSLDEIKDLAVSPVTYTSSAFNGMATGCSRLKDFTFETNEDGTPKTANWKSQAIYLTSYVGYTSYATYILNYNSGITADKQVKDDATYQALKDDPDYFTTDINYSRYNRTSAVNTINSLPDTSAYLAANGGTNTISFKGASGALTDGGAINTLTEEEIAVAAARGWTVSLS